MATSVSIRRTLLAAAAVAALLAAGSCGRRPQPVDAPLPPPRPNREAIAAKPAPKPVPRPRPNAWHFEDGRLAYGAEGSDMIFALATCGNGRLTLDYDLSGGKVYDDSRPVLLGAGGPPELPAETAIEIDEARKGYRAVLSVPLDGPVATGLTEGKPVSLSDQDGTRTWPAVPQEMARAFGEQCRAKTSADGVDSKAPAGAGSTGGPGSGP